MITTRRFMLIAAAAFGLAAVGVWGVFRFVANDDTPRVRFDADARPPAPNYADPSAWAALPGPDHSDAADLVPAGGPAMIDPALAAVDAFYVHAATYRRGAHWNQALGDARVNTATDAQVARAASAFNTCCRVYAPRYRQAFSGTVPGDDARKAREFAYQDIRAAFQYYLDHFNDGRPFILVGQGQGALHVIRLLEERVDASAIRPQLVAAYIVGAALPRAQLVERFKTIGICAKPNDNGCIVGWSMNAGNERAAPREASDTAQNLCINPLTFDTDRPSAPASANSGTLPADGGAGPGYGGAGALPALRPGLVGAACADGLLVTDGPRHTLGLGAPPAGLDDGIALFYGDVRVNAMARVAAFRGSPKP